MKLPTLLIFLLLIGIISCGERQRHLPLIEEENLTTEQIDSILTAFNFDYASPIIIDSSYHVLIPISRVTSLFLLLSFRLHLWKEQDLLDRTLISQHHSQAVNPNTQARSRRHPIL